MRQPFSGGGIRPQQPANGRTALVDVLIEVPLGDYNGYAYDQQTRRLRLAQVQRVGARQPAERGTVSDTLTPQGAPLPALVLAEMATFPGCVVSARPIGALGVGHDGTVEYTIIAVPAADPDLSQYHEWEEVPPAVRAELEGFWRATRRNGATPVTTVNAARAGEIIRAARQAARLAASAQAKAAPRPPAWKAALLTPERRAVLAEEPWSEAEYLLPLLPLRFQEYIADLLFPEERVLFFVERPAMTLNRDGGWFARGRRKVHEGLLVLTDRQLIMMWEPVAPGLTLTNWGFASKVAVLDRLAGVGLRDAGSYLALEIALAAADGAESLTFELPLELRPALEVGIRLLEAFVAPPGARSVRRLYDIAVKQQPWTPEELPVAPEVAARLRAELQRCLLPEEQVLAEAFAPAWDNRQPARLVAVTGQRLVVLPDSSPPSRGAQAIAIAECSSAGVSHSLLGSWLEVAVPHGERTTTVRVAFHSPSFPRFAQVFAALRQLLSRPMALTQGGTP